MISSQIPLLFPKFDWFILLPVRATKWIGKVQTPSGHQGLAATALKQGFFFFLENSQRGGKVKLCMLLKLAAKVLRGGGAPLNEPLLSP